MIRSRVVATAYEEGVQDRFVKTDLDTLVVALYVKIDDEAAGIARLPGRPPKLSHAVALAVIGQQHIERPTRPGTTRRLHHRRRHRTHRPARPGTDRSHLTQLPDRTDGHPLTDRL